MTAWTEPIAIVGVGGLFPGSPDLEAFWSNVAGGVDLSREVSPRRWPRPAAELYDPRLGAPDRVYSTRGCFVDHIPFDPDLWDVDPLWLQRLDPLFKMVLHVGRQAWEDAATASLDRRRVSVILANLILPTETASAMSAAAIEAMLFDRAFGGSGIERSAPRRVEPINRFMAGLPAGLLARALGLGGGAMTLDAACASSLYAIRLACDELRAGRVDAVLTGGVSRPECLYTQMGFSQLRALSASGRPRPFDDRADGLVVGEGAGIFALKRLKDALADRDRIHGLIRAVGLSNDTGGSLLAPDAPGQLRAMIAAYERAEWTPAMLDCVECHATGTPLGDAVELSSLATLWEEFETGDRPCPIGSVKSNVGHLLTAAGAAGLTKMLFALREKTIPPTANFEIPSEGIDWEAGPFRVLTQAEPWPERGPATPRRAAISAFGFGGINAHLLLEEWRLTSGDAGLPPSLRSKPSVEEEADDESEPIAIVGMATRLGAIESLEEFQTAMLTGRSTPRRLSAERAWALGGDRLLPLGHFVDDFSIPVDRFRIPPNELAEMLPQQALMLRTVAEAIDDAKSDLCGAAAPGCDSERRERTGVYIGIGLDLGATNFQARWSIEQRAAEWIARARPDAGEAERARWIERFKAAAGPPLTANRTLGALGSTVASRVAREFQFGGPAFTLSAEEASGLRALEVGVRALQLGDLDRAIVGAVDLGGDIRAIEAASAFRPFAPSGVARPMDTRADGAAPGEGAVALVLKRLDDALSDGDRVYAVVRGLGFASGGAIDAGAPPAEALADAFARARADAGLSAEALAKAGADSIGHLELNAAGAPDEDRIEAEAVARLFPSDAADSICSIGAVKRVVGHCGAASGLTSVAAAAICLYQEMQPAFDSLVSPRAPLGEFEGRLHAPRAPQYWMRDRVDGPRRAGAACLGLDGGAACAILEAHERSAIDAENSQTVALGERIEIERHASIGPAGEAVFPVAANDARELIGRLGELRHWTLEQDGAPMETLARRWMSERGADRGAGPAAALVARDREELLSLIAPAREAIRADPAQRLDGRPPLGDRAFYSPEPMTDGDVAFVFPGSGNQYLGMGAAIAARWPEAMRRLDAQNERLRGQFVANRFAPPRLDWSGDWRPAAERALDDDHLALIFGSVCFGSLMSDLVRSFGVEPKAVIGYSLGETAGYFAMRAWTDRDAMLRRARESTLFTQDLVGPCKAARAEWGLADGESVDWRVGVVDRPAAEVRAALEGAARAYLLIINSPGECVIGGQGAAVEAAVARLGCNFAALRGVSTVHCEIAKRVRGAYRGLHLFKTTPPADVRFYSCAFGRSYEVGRQATADSILGQAIATIDFPRVVEKAYEEGARVFIELGPRASCSRTIGRILGDRPHLARSANLAGQDEVSSVLRLAAFLHVHRGGIDLGAVHGLERRDDARPVEIEAPPAKSAVQIRLGRSLDELARPDASEGEAERPPVAPSRVEQLDVFALDGNGSNEAQPRPRRTPREDAPRPRPRVAAASDLQPLVAIQAANSEAHEAFLRWSESATRVQTKAIALQMELLHAARTVARSDAAPPSSLDRAACLQFARGSIAAALGPRYAAIDELPSRVRLPDEPLMFVDRIVEIDGEPLGMGRGRVVTEHDVRPGAWYLEEDRMPTGLSIEAGQADLFLSGYLGVDLKTRGLSHYRLLDAAVFFHRSPPRAGEVVRYDIRIERFFRQGSTQLFSFDFDGYVGEELVMSMREGCAGFFTPRQLDEGRGIVAAKARDRRSESAPSIEPFASMRAESLDADALDALREGDLKRAFGGDFARLESSDPIGLPSGRMALIHRVARIDPKGGRYGRGFIRAEIDIHPDDWFLTCHFSDDPVMPGTLMYDSCLQALRVYLMRMGWVGERGRCAFEPIPGVQSRLKCRGQVIPTTREVAYELSIKRLEYGPAPGAIADAVMLADGRAIVEVKDMSIRLAGSSERGLRATWEKPKRAAKSAKRKKTPAALYDRDAVLAYAVGEPSKCFGEAYRVFDRERFLARLPGPPYLFLDRITQVEAEPMTLRAGGTVVGEFDALADAWHVRANRQPTLAFSVLLEAPLQVCGWFAAYMGSALTSREDLHFRNLGGGAILFADVAPGEGTLVSRVKCLDVSRSGGMIVQKFSFDVTLDERPVYRGETMFGFFSKAALAQQVGVRGAKRYEPTDDEAARARAFAIEDAAPRSPEEPAPPIKPGLLLPGRAYRMIDRIDAFVPDGGPSGLGFIRGSKAVDPADWFFAAHFHQDPVWPGSLGLEGFIQLLKVVAIERWGADIATTHRFEPIALGEPHEWTYRGQVLPGDGRVEIEAAIERIDDAARLLHAGGLLEVDGRIIYQMKSFAVRAVPIEKGGGRR